MAIVLRTQINVGVKTHIHNLMNRLVVAQVLNQWRVECGNFIEAVVDLLSVPLKIVAHHFIARLRSNINKRPIRYFEHYNILMMPRLRCSRLFEFAEYDIKVVSKMIANLINRLEGQIILAAKNRRNSTSRTTKALCQISPTHTFIGKHRSKVIRNLIRFFFNWINSNVSQGVPQWIRRGGGDLFIGSNLGLIHLGL